MNTVLVVVAGFLMTLGIASKVLPRTFISPAMVAVAAGVLFGPALGVLPVETDNAGVLLLAQVSLAILLFVDATRVDLGLVRRNGRIPARMLIIGLPLAIALGTAAGMAVLGLGVGLAFLLACVLAPTDAALGQAVMTDERVPRGVRQALNVESGLNDGLAAPFVAVALVLVEATTGEGASLVVELAQLILGGLAVGALVGGGVGTALQRLGWRTLQAAPRQVAVGALPVLAYGLAGLVGGNGFVAAFAAGIAFAATFDDAHDLVEFGEDAGELLALTTFLVFGAVFTGFAASALSGRVVLYAVLSLTVVRMLPIGLSLIGTGLRRTTVGLLGWFGPRGLASVVFGLEVLEFAEGGRLPGGEEVFGVVALVVVGSVVLHGVSARPLATAYARHLDRSPGPDAMPEHADGPDVPMRRRASGDQI